MSNLETTIASALDKGQWQIDEAVHLLKSASFADGVFNTELLLRLFLRSIAGFMTSDLDTLLAMTPLSVQTQMGDRLQTILELEGLLHTGHFARFWETYAAGKAALKVAAVPAFEDILRSAIGYALSACLESTSEAEAAAALSTKDVSKVLAPFKAVVAKGVVTFQLSHTNSHTESKSGSISLEELVAVAAV